VLRGLDEFGRGQGVTHVSETPVVRIAELEIDPVQLDAYTAHLKEEIEASLDHETGVLLLSAVGLEKHPGQIRILEIYANLQSYESHLQSPHFLRYKSATAGMIRSLTLLETNPICLRSSAALQL
jgi:quinol monooxygenase YgiN